MQLTYGRYLDQVLGGWIGKSLGGAAGARFEGQKHWIEVRPEELFPEKIPPNDDLDLQVLWLKVLEEKGAALTANDLAAAWNEHCWYPFNEYGIFRRNWRLGLHPPVTGTFGNQFWDTGMGCPIRAEIWGYVFPGAPDLAARYAALDGSLDHGPESIGAEQMFAAMAAQAFLVSDVRRLVEMSLHFLPPGSTVERLTRAAFQAHAEGLTLREARDRLMLLGGNPEACDARTNVPFTFLALLYGKNDLLETMLCALRCGYDTDCTLATAAALLGQIQGASRIPETLKQRVGDELVMGIEYHRPEMTLTALARDTARVGLSLTLGAGTGHTFTGAPALVGIPGVAPHTGPRMRVEYAGRPAVRPGESLRVTVYLEGTAKQTAPLQVSAPAGWKVLPESALLGPDARTAELLLVAPPWPGENAGAGALPASVREPAKRKLTPLAELLARKEPDSNAAPPAVAKEPPAPVHWPQKNLCVARWAGPPAVEHTFGVVGAGLWRFLGAFYDTAPETPDACPKHRLWNHHFVSLAKDYLPEPELDEAALFRATSRALGRPALVTAYENEIDLAQVLGLSGPCCAYLSRTLISPEERAAFFMIGHADSYRLYLNGQKVAERDEVLEWTPFNDHVLVTLRPGPNKLLLKLVRRREPLRFTFGVREKRGPHAEGGFNCNDWMVDLADAF